MKADIYSGSFYRCLVTVRPNRSLACTTKLREQLSNQSSNLVEHIGRTVTLGIDMSPFEMETCKKAHRCLALGGHLSNEALLFFVSDGSFAL